MSPIGASSVAKNAPWLIGAIVGIMEMEENSMKWEEMDVEEKVNKACSLMKSVSHASNPFIAFSGGKDSVVLEFLAKEAKLKLPLMHNVTTIDPEGTLSFCKRHGATLLRSGMSFLDLVEKKGFPTMFRRFCCQFLKEQYIGNCGFFGIRKNESVKRSQCYDDVSDIYYYSKKQYTERFFPILYFTDDDIRYLVEKHSIENHPIYYDHQGKFCVERRLGCIGCPLQGDRGKSDYLQYPLLLKQVLRRGILFHQRMGRTADDAALNLVYNLFYSNGKYELFEQTYKGLFDTDPWEILDSYFFLEKDEVMRRLPKPKF